MEDTHQNKLAVMHAIWLCWWDLKESHEVVLPRVAKMLRVTDEELGEFIGNFDYDWSTTCFCGRPTNWNPVDSLNTTPKN